MGFGVRKGQGPSSHEERGDRESVSSHEHQLMINHHPRDTFTPWSTVVLSSDFTTARETRKQQGTRHHILTGALLFPMSCSSHRHHALSGRSWPAPHGVEKETEESCPIQGSTVHIFIGSGHLVQTCQRFSSSSSPFAFMEPK